MFFKEVKKMNIMHTKQILIYLRDGGSMKCRNTIDHPFVCIGRDPPTVHNWSLFLKPMYSFGKSWKWKNSLMGFVHRVCTSSKSPVNTFYLKPSIFWENCIKLIFSGCPRKFCHRVMYIHVAPSSDHIH